MAKFNASEVLKGITLSDSEKKELENIASDLIKTLKRLKLNAFIGGSLAKGTLVKKERQDVDIFVQFENEKELEKLGKILDKAKLNANVVHGSRDYYHIETQKCLLEIIPVLKIDSPENAKNVTDVSLTHVNYVRKKISKNKKLADEIILAKAFCQANKVYGAESYIGGFSGYALEVLVCHFGSFIKLLKELGKKKVIDPEKQFRNEKEVFRELNSSKLSSPIVLIDPTYKYRNVCAGLTTETYEQFLLVAKSFLKNPSKDFFVKKEFDKKEFEDFAKENGAKYLELMFETDRQEGDIAGTKMKKFYRFVLKHLEKRQQKVLKSEFVYSSGQTAKGYFVILENNELVFSGPNKSLKKAFSEFKKQHKKIYEKKGKIFAVEKITLNEALLETETIGRDMGVVLGF
jgi:tRNA nucleotidyltransferase (CCA-adding enzyme)